MDEEKKETKITFKKVSDTYVSILLNGKQVGHIFSKMDSGTKPYPHEHTEYCNTSIQLCGFDRCSEVWACGIFSGKKDLVVNFIDTSEEYRNSKLGTYKFYVKNHLNSNKEINELMNFSDWDKHNI